MRSDSNMKYIIFDNNLFIGEVKAHYLHFITKSLSNIIM
jgi:hypothetical protein